MIIFVKQWITSWFLSSCFNDQAAQKPATFEAQSTKTLWVFGLLLIQEWSFHRATFAIIGSTEAVPEHRKHENKPPRSHDHVIQHTRISWWMSDQRFSVLYSNLLNQFIILKKRSPAMYMYVAFYLWNALTPCLFVFHDKCIVPQSLVILKTIMCMPCFSCTSLIKPSGNR